MNLFAIFGILSTIAVSIWAVSRYLILGSYKIDNDMSKRLIASVETDAKFKWIISNEYVTDPRYPDVYEALVSLYDAWFYINRNERLLTAGWKGKEETTFVTFPRWHRRKILAALRKKALEDLVVPVMLLSPHGGADRLGELKADLESKTILDNCADIEAEVQDVVDGKKSKTGILLHGPPGNGKTQFIKHLAKKHALPIYVVYLNPEYSNHDMALLFSSVPRRCIILMEDFDNYFNGRECIMKNDQVKFTFDAFINGLDGVHNDYRQVVFAMTANNLSKIDDSLKNRPSRFKFVKELGPPSSGVRLSILGDPKLVEETEGLSLDSVFNYQHESSSQSYCTTPQRKRGRATSKSNSKKQTGKRKNLFGQA